MAKPTTAWTSYNGTGEVSNANEDIERITEAGDTRITEASDTRILEDSVYSPKSATTWTESNS